jgi:predicted transcriptional regulator
LQNSCSFFFADWAARFDLNAVEWLDKELLPDPPDGSRHVLDLVAKLRALEPTAIHDTDRPESWLALVHVEIESPDRTTRIEPRLPSYYVHLRDKSQLPVLPIVVYLKVGLEGIGIGTFDDTHWGFTPLTIRYLYVGLPGLDAVQYLEGDNWLGVALTALMKIPKERVAWLGAEALRRLVEAPLTEQKRFLLSDCVDAYIPLDAESRKTFEQITMGEQYAGVRAMNKTVFEHGLETGIERGIAKGLEKGIERGRHVGHFEVAEAMLTKYFGVLSETTLGCLRGLSSDQLLDVLMRAPAAKSLADLGVKT